MPTVAKIMAREARAHASTSPKIMSELIKETKDSVETLEAVVEGVGSCLEGLKPLKKDMIGELRSLRMTTTTEASQMLKPLEEIRQFFLSDKHEQEVERLEQFVSLCERLQLLKESGFLDSVADIMLKLEE